MSVDGQPYLSWSSLHSQPGSCPPTASELQASAMQCGAANPRLSPCSFVPLSDVSSAARLSPWLACELMGGRDHVLLFLTYFTKKRSLMSHRNLVSVFWMDGWSMCARMGKLSCTAIKEREIHQNSYFFTVLKNVLKRINCEQFQSQRENTYFLRLFCIMEIFYD